MPGRPALCAPGLRVSVSSASHGDTWHVNDAVHTLTIDSQSLTVRKLKSWNELSFWRVNVVCITPEIWIIYIICWQCGALAVDWCWLDTRCWPTLAGRAVSQRVTHKVGLEIFLCLWTRVLFQPIKVGIERAKVGLVTPEYGGEEEVDTSFCVNPPPFKMTDVTWQKGRTWYFKNIEKNNKNVKRHLRNIPGW